MTDTPYLDKLQDLRQLINVFSIHEKRHHGNSAILKDTAIQRRLNKLGAFYQQVPNSQVPEKAIIDHLEQFKMFLKKNEVKARCFRESQQKTTISTRLDALSKTKCCFSKLFINKVKQLEDNLVKTVLDLYEDNNEKIKDRVKQIDDYSAIIKTPLHNNATKEERRSATQNGKQSRASEYARLMQIDRLDDMRHLWAACTEVYIKIINDCLSKGDDATVATESEEECLNISEDIFQIMTGGMSFEVRGSKVFRSKFGGKSYKTWCQEMSFGIANANRTGAQTPAGTATVVSALQQLVEKFPKYEQKLQPMVKSMNSKMMTELWNEVRPMLIQVKQQVINGAKEIVKTVECLRPGFIDREESFLNEIRCKLCNKQACICLQCMKCLEKEYIPTDDESESSKAAQSYCTCARCLKCCEKIPAHVGSGKENSLLKEHKCSVDFVGITDDILDPNEPYDTLNIGWNISRVEPKCKCYKINAKIMQK